MILFCFTNYFFRLTILHLNRNTFTMNVTTTQNTTSSMPPVNLTQAVNILSFFANATTWPNTTSFQQITSYNGTSKLASTHAPNQPLSGNCQSFEYDFHKNIPISAVCGICFLFGIMLVFVGRLFV